AEHARGRAPLHHPRPGKRLRWSTSCTAGSQEMPEVVHLLNRRLPSKPADRTPPESSRPDESHLSSISCHRCCPGPPEMDARPPRRTPDHPHAPHEQTRDVIRRLEVTPLGAQQASTRRIGRTLRRNYGERST